MSPRPSSRASRGSECGGSIVTHCLTGSCAAAIGSMVTFSPVAISHFPFYFANANVEPLVPFSKCRPSGLSKASVVHFAIDMATSGRLNRTVISPILKICSVKYLVCFLDFRFPAPNHFHGVDPLSIIGKQICEHPHVVFVPSRLVVWLSLRDMNRPCSAAPSQALRMAQSGARRSMRL